jgi:galactokinase
MTGIAAQLVDAGMSEVASRSRALMFGRVEAALRAKHVEPTHRFHVPGRIEVLGKHTDYAGGRSLLTAVERGFCVASAARKDAFVSVTDVGRGEEVMLSLQGPVAIGAPHWAIYPATVIRRFVRDFGIPLHGTDVSFESDLPPSSGLSSSSALLIATFEALRVANGLGPGLEVDAGHSHEDTRDVFRRSLPGVLDVAAYLGSVESGRPFRGFFGEAGVGTSGGSQDHTAILASEAGRICQFGFGPMQSLGSVALPGGVTFVIGVSGVAADKTGGACDAYNRAAALSAALLEVWQSKSGRTAPTLYQAIGASDDEYRRLKEALPSNASEFAQEDLEARLDQFMEESLELIPAAFEALRAGDLTAFGSVVDRSQKGAERGLQNQVRETIELARLARSMGAHAATAFGAGFGGSVWAMVDRNDADRFSADWERSYDRQFGHRGAMFFRSDAGPPLVRLTV